MNKNISKYHKEGSNIYYISFNEIKGVCKAKEINIKDIEEGCLFNLTSDLTLWCRATKNNIHLAKTLKNVIIVS